MQKVLWLILSVMMIAEARENPFRATDSAANVGKATQIDEKLEDFNTSSIVLPSTARILKSVTVTFQNLDGSISEEVVGIDKVADWHYPLILSPKKPVVEAPAPVSTSAAKTAPKEKEVPVVSASTDTNNSNSVEQNVKKTDVVATPKQPVKTPVKDPLKLSETVSLGFQGKEITIFSKDTKIRDFLVADPYKVVVDFKKSRSFSTKTVPLDETPFTSATIGDHDGFYRVAIALDGQYRYDIEPFNGGYIIRLK